MCMCVCVWGSEGVLLACFNRLLLYREYCCCVWMG
jgi:hypothetical protein